jgi:hypothetical protein
LGWAVSFSYHCSKRGLKDHFSKCRPIVDADGVVIGVLGAMPQDEDWGEVCRRAESALDDARGKLFVPEKDRVHRRGAFSAFRMGLSHGGGQGVCFYCGILYLISLMWL